MLSAPCEALNGGPGRERLSWVKAGALADPSVVTLFVVLDGLGFPDARLLAREVELRGQGLLTLVDQDLALAPLPTITAVAKPALVRAVPPNEAHESADRGRMLSQPSLVSRIMAAKIEREDAAQRRLRRLSAVHPVTCLRC